jgi:hypothetical protein
MLMLNEKHQKEAQGPEEMLLKEEEVKVGKVCVCVYEKS